MPLLFLSLVAFTLRSATTTAAPILPFTLRDIPGPLNIFPRTPINASVEAGLNGTPIEFNTNYRSVWEIVWTCWITIFACIWISVHPNVRGHKATWGAIMRQRVELLFWGFISPEVVVVWAYRQWRGAKAINASVLSKIEKIKEEDPAAANGLIDWTITHSHTLQMGGYIFERDGVARYYEPVFDSPGEKKPEEKAEQANGPGQNNETEGEKGGQRDSGGGKTVDSANDDPGTVGNTEQKPAKDFNDFLEAIIRRRDTEEELQDRSKADAFTKGIVLFQTGWFIVQIIARKVQDLTITELEITTLAYAAMTAMMYIFWWHKPLDLQRPIIVTAPSPSCKRADVPTPAVSLSEAVALSAAKIPEVVVIPPSDNPQNEALHRDPNDDTQLQVYGSELPFAHTDDTTGTSTEDNAIPSPHPDARMANTIGFNPPSSPPPDKPTEAEEQEGLVGNPNEPQPATPTSKPGWVRTLFLRLDVYINKTLFKSKEPAVLSSTGGITLGFRIFFFSILALALSPLLFMTRVSDIIVSSTFIPEYDASMESPYRPPRVSFPTFYAYSKQFSSQSMVAIFVGAAFGAIHCAAWNFTFHLPRYRVLWRASALFICLSPIGGGFFAGMFDVSEKSHARPIVKKLIALFLLFLIVAMVVLYGVARWILFVVTLLELSHLPPSAHQDVEWTSFVPHV